MQRENKCLLFFQKKRSICDDCQELTHLIMCKILVMDWKYFKLHLNFRRNGAKNYFVHIQQPSTGLKEKELILDLAVLCKFIIMQLQDWQALDHIIFGREQEAKRSRQDLGLVSAALTHI